MPHDRFYIDAPLEGHVSIEGEELRHLHRVMRKKEGDTVELINGKNTLAQGEILTLTKKEAQIAITHAETHKPILPPLVLIQALPKLPLLDLIIQKGTELGVSTFYLYPSAHSEKKTLSPTQMHRLEQILIASIKQCARLDLPTIAMGFPSLEMPLFFGDLSKEAPPLSEKACLPAALAIGPEQGFTLQEIAQLKEKGEGVRLAPYTLRTETAALAGLTLLANSMG